MIITAIYDKKSKTIGKPIFQRNVEEAIQGVKDALNSIDQYGKYLMPAHREHPEDYKLIQLGQYWDTKITDVFTENENGIIGYKGEEECRTNFILCDEKDIIEFKDIELKETKIKVDAETIYAYCQSTMKELGQQIADTAISLKETRGEITNRLELTKELLKEVIKDELGKLGQTDMGGGRSDNRRHRHLLWFLK